MYEISEKKRNQICDYFKKIKDIKILENIINQINKDKWRCTKKFANDNGIKQIIELRLEKLKNKEKKNYKKSKFLTNHNSSSSDYDNHKSSYIGGTMYFMHPVDGNSTKYNN
jgi:hypothetical protein